MDFGVIFSVTQFIFLLPIIFIIGSWKKNKEIKEFKEFKEAHFELETLNSLNFLNFLKLNKNLNLNPRRKI